MLCVLTAYDLIVSWRFSFWRAFVQGIQCICAAALPDRCVSETPPTSIESVRSMLHCQNMS